MFKKRAQGLSINVIIIAVIGLIILVVVIAMFTGRLSAFSKGIESTVTCENTCKALGKTGTDDATCTDGQKIAGDYKDATNGCCCT